MFDIIQNSESCASSFEARLIKKYWSKQNEHSLPSFLGKIHLEDNSKQIECTVARTQENANNTTPKEEMKNDIMAGYSKIAKDNPWWEEQETCDDHHAVPFHSKEDEYHPPAVEQRDEKDWKVCEDEETKTLSTVQEVFDANVNHDGSGLSEDGDSSTITSSSAGAEFKLFDEMSVVTDESSMGDDDYNKEDKDE
ncbi:unnamed protein product [Pseudo-nitzschia multistriata]|uniref:Uncharacterized protein n=1 Tax=Pseudo-nitzschia multistriata TaxID=183589 RepID=A0A448ZBK9_9STRA|nr:unnamed protein product [Pseudo-nitzschia multistriata]